MGRCALSTLSRTFLSVTAAFVLFACSEGEPITPVAEVPDAQPEKSMPPGFLDEPPPPPTSATAILSGGILLLPDGSELTDSLVVITNGDLVAWGTRGAVEVPSDSIGFDLRGKWIEPIALDRQAPAALRIADQDPRIDGFNGTYVGGYEDGTLTLPEPED